MKDSFAVPAADTDFSICQSNKSPFNIRQDAEMCCYMDLNTVFVPIEKNFLLLFAHDKCTSRR